MRAVRKAHIAANIIAFGLLGAFLVYFLISFAGLPERIGVHFGPDGDFDVIAEKIFGFYPFAAGFGLLGLFSLITLAVNKARPGKHITEKGHTVIAAMSVITLDIMKLIWSAFFSAWTYCVVQQVGMNTDILRSAVIVYLLLLPSLGLASAITAAVFRKKKEDSRNSV